MEFLLKQRKESSIFRSRLFVTGILFTALAITIVGLVIMESADPFSLFFLAIFIFVSVIFFLKQRAYGTFILDDEGIKVNDKIFPWEKVINYHWLGQAQNERIGMVASGGMLQYDPVNPNSYADTQVARIRIKKSFLNKFYLNLEIDSDKVEQFKSILSEKGIEPLSKWRLFLGT